MPTWVREIPESKIFQFYCYRTSFVTEFNAHNDPHAFHIVVKHFPQIVMITFESIFGMQPKNEDYKEIFLKESRIGSYKNYNLIF